MTGPLPLEVETGTGSRVKELLKVGSMIRYRFFLYAGLFPYLLGAAWAFGMEAVFDGQLFWAGLFGILLSLVGVETFNEYFDSREGTDRVFNPEDEDPIPSWVLWLGVASFAAAFTVGIFLTVRAGWPVLVYAILGGIAAIFYVAPPIRWAYRGFGETVIALSYGPWMVLASVYLHTRAFSLEALWASAVPGFLIMALAVINEIPDYYQDRLVGKRNLVVRLGRGRGVWLYVGLAAAGLGVAVVGAAVGIFPLTVFAVIAAAPLLVASARAASKTYQAPRSFIPAVRQMVLCYVIGVGLFACGIFANRWLAI